MPVETWRAHREMNGGVSVVAPLVSAMPFRILNKGPEYFRRQAGPNARKPSAVERLEADKAKYVKSKQVATTRQEPVKPLLLKQPLFSPGVRRVLLTPNRKASPGVGGRRRDACGVKNSLNLDILNSLISLCDSPMPSPRAETSPLALERRGKQDPQGWALDRVKGSADGQSKQSESSATSKNSSTVAVRRVDVLPSTSTTQRPRVCPALLVTPVPASPVQSQFSSTSSLTSPLDGRTDSGKKPTLLHRSKSDLSDRYSRASADLERFFNYCGLDPQEMEHIGVEHFARASSDIVSIKFHSISTASSECAPSQRSTATVEEKPDDRMPYGISVIERNARVIKWLYGLRQAREHQKVSKV